MGRRAALRVRKRLEELGTSGLDWKTLSQSAIAEIENVVPADAWCVASADPSTLFMTDVTGEDLGSDLHQFFELEYTKADFLLQNDLASVDPHVGSLMVATEGRPERSIRWRELLEPFGYHDQLRGALVAPSGCWGFFSLVRTKSNLPYSPAEVTLVASLVRKFAEAMRDALTSDEDRAPGGTERLLLVLADDLTVLETSDGAAEVFGSALHVGGPVPPELLAVAVKARDAMRRASGDARGTSASATVRQPAGWLRVEALPLSGSNASRIGILLEQIRPYEATDLIFRTRGLTSREKQITRAVLAGDSTQEIAQTLHLSPLTVQQHLKAIFAKFDVSSRRELMASLFFSHLGT
jgi:DNA-binding CsgD family transcriptional regulator